MLVSEHLIGLCYMFLKVFAVYYVFKICLRSKYRVLRFVTDVFLFTRDKFAIGTNYIQYIKTDNLHGRDYHHHHYDGHDFIVVNSDKTDLYHVHDSLLYKNDVVFVNVVINNKQFDITHDIRRFVCYFRNKRLVDWDTVLIYCFKDHDDTGLFDKSTKVEIHYNDDEMTSEILSIDQLLKYKFGINPVFSSASETGTEDKSIPLCE